MHGRDIFTRFDQCLHYFLIFCVFFFVVFRCCLFMPVDAWLRIQRVNASSYNHSSCKSTETCSAGENLNQNIDSISFPIIKSNISAVYTALHRWQRTNSREIHSLRVAHQAERCEHEQKMKMTCTFFCDVSRNTSNISRIFSRKAFTSQH